jgi:hydrogenase expression/formation protein HypC
MCLAIPGKVIEVQQDAAGVRMAKTDFGGVLKQVCLEYTPEVNPGDYILVHVGFALSRVDEAEAQRTYRALEELNQLTELHVVESDLTAAEQMAGLPKPGIHPSDVSTV